MREDALNILLGKFIFACKQATMTQVTTLVHCALPLCNSIHILNLADV